MQINFSAESACLVENWPGEAKGAEIFSLNDREATQTSRRVSHVKVLTPS